MSSYDSTPEARAQDRLQDDLARLVRTAGPDTGEVFLLEKDSIAIGRAAESNDLVLADDEISRSHARLMRLPGGDWQLEDHSTNGSCIDGLRIERTVLRNGAVIAFGSGRQSSFQFFSHAPTPTPVASTHLQVVFDTQTVGNFLLVAGTIVIGRNPGADGVMIDSPLVAARHAALEVASDGSAVLSDLGPGVSVNGIRVARRRLEDGDLIQLGSCESHVLLFRDAGVRRRELGEFDLTKKVVRIGRADDNDVTLAHPTVSSHHAEIRHLASGQVELVDLGSVNGSFVNGSRIGRATLKPHDRIALGAMQLVFDGLQLEREADGKSIFVYAENLSKVVKDSNGRSLCVLDDVSIVLQPNEFIGLLGPSGAGKSTLMDAMNGFRPVEGQVRMNERSLYQYPKLLRELIGYLPQDDILHAQLTVRQCLAYSARLRMPSDYSQREIDIQVDRVLTTLRLTDRADTVIGALSGGQRKRASLGIELLSDPAVLYVDEPTAGQDPATVMQMMQIFRNLANRGSTVVINTHLLGSFGLLDKVAVLASGKLVFYGPASQMLAYFNCKRAIEVYYKLAPPGMGREDEERIAEEWKLRFRDSHLYAEHVLEPMAKARAQDGAASGDGDTRRRPTTSWLTQVGTLLRRQLTLRMTEASSRITLLLPPAFIGVLLCFMARQPNEPMTLLIAILVAMWFSCSGNVREIVDEWAIYRRERQRSLRLATYLGAKLVYLIGLSGAQTLLLVAILTIGGALSGHFLGAWAIVWSMGVQGGLIGLLISACTSSSERALYTFPLVMIPELLLAGLLIPVHSMAPTAGVSAVPGLVMQLPNGDGRQMNGFLASGLSPLMVSRWGLESLRELYVHDQIAQPLPPGFSTAVAVAAAKSSAAMKLPLGQSDYRYPLLSSISSTFHPNELEAALKPIPRLAGEPAFRYEFFSTGNLPDKSTLAPYAGIQGLFLLGMIGTIWLAIRRREGTS